MNHKIIFLRKALNTKKKSKYSVKTLTITLDIDGNKN